MTAAYDPTPQQEAVVAHEGSAFVTACPGAGKTRTLVERARLLLGDSADRRGVAFLSFTNAAVSEFEARLRGFGILPAPLFPSFIGTFDRFLWQFFISPFGIEGCGAPPRLMPDKQHWPVQPHHSMQALPLRAFDRHTGRVDRAVAAEEGYPRDRDASRHEACALKILTDARTKGHVDFADVRESVHGRLADKPFAERLGKALAARFREVVVDEAQDCNPEDLEVVQWLRDSGLAVKVICDPHQAIYQFRGGVTDELSRFQTFFIGSERLPMSGNFRSTPAICAAIVALRPPDARDDPDQPLGRYKADLTPVHILSYGGTSVPVAISHKFTSIAQDLGIGPSQAPILASRLASAAKAIGHPALEDTEHMTLSLAKAVTDFHFSFAHGDRREALNGLHRAVLLTQGHITSAGAYQRYLATHDLQDGRWRPWIIEIADQLQFRPGMTVDAWLAEARKALAFGLATSGTIAQRLRSSRNLEAALAVAPSEAHPTRTIHSVKGLEFPAVCVVLTASKTKGILSHLEGDDEESAAEDARRIYVAASRAQRLLAMAIPKSGAGRLEALLHGCGCETQRHNL